MVFSFVGMKNQEIAVSNRSGIDVTLENETIGLDEVVAIGYGVITSYSIHYTKLYEGVNLHMPKSPETNQ